MKVSNVLFVDWLVALNALAGLDEEVIKALQSARRLTKNQDLEEDEDEEEDKKPILPSTETDMQNCFGFDVRLVALHRFFYANFGCLFQEDEEDDQQRDALDLLAEID